MGAETHMSVKEQHAWALGHPEEECLGEMDQRVQRPQYNDLAIMLFPVQLPSDTADKDRACGLFTSCPTALAYDFGICFCRCPLSDCELILFYSYFAVNFSHEWCWLLCTYGDFVAFPLHSVDMVNYTDSFVNVKPNLHSWDLPQLVMIHYPFFIFLELIC